jgi:hypothetical protein
LGERVADFRAHFNGSVRIESRSERLSGDAGALLLRDGLERLGFVDWLGRELVDRRKRELIVHPLKELVLTSILLLAQGWRDQDDADTLHDDPALRLAVSTRRGTASLLPAPLDDDGQRVQVPDGLASQPTLSRLARDLSGPANRSTLRRSLVKLAARRIRSLRAGGHRPRYVTIDVDSLPIEVHGHQPGSAHNGHYHARVYHPLVATLGEAGDIVDAQLREGNCHTAEGALDFVLPLLDRVEQDLCQVASVRIDAGFPEEKFLAALERRGTGYVARVRNNRVLDRMAAPYLKRPAGRPPAEPRIWTYEMTYAAKSWSRERRVVLVVLEREEELFLHHFWLITNWPPEQMPAEELLPLYRQRGTAEGHMGELMDVLAPALSSAPRPKDHYRGQKPKKRYPAADSFHLNEVRLLLNCLAYNTGHLARVVVEAETGQGWSLRRVRERVLRVAARILIHGRYATVVIGRTTARAWECLTTGLQALAWNGP